MPKPVKKAVRKLKTLPKPKRPTDPSLAAHAILMKNLMRATAAEPSDKPPTVDELYRANMAELGSKGGHASGAKRMDMPIKERRRIASLAARTRWAKKGAKKR
jgi:hypothetical protein